MVGFRGTFRFFSTVFRYSAALFSESGVLFSQVISTSLTDGVGVWQQMMACPYGKTRIYISVRGDVYAGSCG